MVAVAMEIMVITMETKENLIFLTKMSLKMSVYLIRNYF